MKQSFFSYFGVLFFLFCWKAMFFNVFADETPSIKNIQENIEKLEQEEKKLTFAWQNFRIGNENLSSLLKTNLSSGEKNNLDILVENYSQEQKQIESQIQKMIQNGEDFHEYNKQILLLKENFYKSLLIYIELEKLPIFMKYVENDTKLNEKSKIITRDIAQANKLQEERIQTIKDNIEDHSRNLRKQIEDKMKVQVQAKFQILFAQAKFQNLSNAAKILLFENFLEKVRQKSQLIESTSTTSFHEEQKIIYDSLESIILDYIKQWK